MRPCATSPKVAVSIMNGVLGNIMNGVLGNIMNGVLGNFF